MSYTSAMRPRSSDGKPKNDAWASRYLLDDGSDHGGSVRGVSGLSVPSAGDGTSGSSRRSSFDEDRKALRELHSSAFATNRGTSLGLASSISRDLHSPVKGTASGYASGTASAAGSIGPSASSTGPGRPSLQAPFPSPGLSPSSAGSASPGKSLSRVPSLSHFEVHDPASGLLSKVVGSLLDPQAQRDKWNCKRCHTVFARDATIYAEPSSSTSAGAPASTGQQPPAYYCRACYASLFSLGACAGCAHAVLGTTREDGAFVRVSSAGTIYHGRCFRCVHCERGGGRPPLGDATEVIVGMDGRPTCLDCFDRPRPRAQPSPQRTSLAEPYSSLSVSPSRADAGQHEAGRSPGGGAAPRNPKMAASIVELSRRFGKEPPASALPKADTNMPPPSSPASASVSASPSGTVAPPARPAAVTRSQPLGALAGFARTPSAVPPAGGRTSSFSSVSGSGAAGAASPLVSGSFANPVPSLSGGRAGSPTKPRPLTASFGSERFNLAAFQSTRDAPPTHLSRKDSRSRSLSPVKLGAALTPSLQTRASFDYPSSMPRSATAEQSSAAIPQAAAPAGDKCALCGSGPFEGPQRDALEAVMVSLQSGEALHKECFNCGVCGGEIDAGKPFVRLDELLASSGRGRPGAPAVDSHNKYAHAACAPISLAQRPAAPSSAPLTLPSPSAPAHDHATHQRRPSPSATDRVPLLPPTSSYLPKAGEIPAPSSGFSSHAPQRTFKSTAGAAPPTKSTFLPRAAPVAAPANPAAGIFSKRPPASTAAAARSMETGTDASPRLGGMQACPGCGRTASALESVPGPRGTRWHRACLVCCGEAPPAAGGYLSLSAQAARKCGKKLDSGAKVDVEGRVMCRDCFDRSSRQGRAGAAAAPLGR